MKKKLFLLIKALVSIALIAYLLSKTEFAAVIASIKSASPYYLLLAFITLYFGKLLTGIRWQRLLAAQGIHIRLRTLIASLFVSQFFNNFLPTTVGQAAVSGGHVVSPSRSGLPAIPQNIPAATVCQLSGPK